MKTKIRSSVRNALFRAERTVQVDRSRILVGQITAAQILNGGSLRRINDAGFGVFSQTDEDGIIGSPVLRPASVIGRRRGRLVSFICRKR